MNEYALNEKNWVMYRAPEAVSLSSVFSLPPFSPISLFSLPYLPSLSPSSLTALRASILPMRVSAVGTSKAAIHI